MKSLILSFLLLAILVFTVLLIGEPVAQESEPAPRLPEAGKQLEFRVAKIEAILQREVEVPGMEELQSRVAELERSVEAVRPAGARARDDSSAEEIERLRRKNETLQRTVDG
ncbi:MAG: hypothetical protein AB8B91_21170, partial [Rubripirellula sp.]